MKLSDQQKGTLLAFTAVLIITPDSLLIRLTSVEDWGLIFYRGLIGSITISLIFLFFDKKNFFKSFLLIGLAGVLNVLVIISANITFILSIENTNVANTLVMLSLTPFIAAIISFFVLREKPPLRTCLAIIITFSCVIFIFYDSMGTGRLFGDILGVMTATAVGGSAVIIRYAKKINFIPTIIIGKFTVALISLIFAKSLILHGNDLIYVLLMGLFTIGIPFYLLTIAPKYITATEVSLFWLLETALGPFWVWLVIKEQPSVNTIIGGSIIIFTIFIHSLLSLKKDRKKQAN